MLQLPPECLVIGLPEDEITTAIGALALCVNGVYHGVKDFEEAEGITISQEAAQAINRCLSCPARIALNNSGEI